MVRCRYGPLLGAIWLLQFRFFQAVNDLLWWGITTRHFSCKFDLWVNVPRLDYCTCIYYYTIYLYVLHCCIWAHFTYTMHLYVLHCCICAHFIYAMYLYVLHCCICAHFIYTMYLYVLHCCICAHFISTMFEGIISNEFNPFQPSVAFLTEISHSICNVNQVIGFYMNSTLS